MIAFIFYIYPCDIVFSHFIRPKDLQEVILVIPSGVSKLMDQLSDSREVIRNDVRLSTIGLYCTDSQELFEDSTYL